MKYVHAGANEGIRELIYELGKSKNGRSGKGVHFYVLSAKWIQLIAFSHQPPKTMLIRPVNDFVVVADDTQIRCNQPAFNMHAEVVRTSEGRLYFRENEQIFTSAELVAKLLNLITESEPVH